MRDFETYEFFWIEFFNGVIGSTNIYLAMELYLTYSESYYLIAFCIIYAIHRLLACLVFFPGGFNYLLNFLFDSLYLGSFNANFYDEKYSYQLSMINHASLKLVLSMALSTIYFFCLGYIHKTNYNDSIVYISYFSILFQILFFSLLIVLYSCEYSNNPKIRLFVNGATLYLSISTLSQFSDNLGVNLAYYQLVLSGSAFLMMAIYLIFNGLMTDNISEVIMFLSLNIIYHQDSEYIVSKIEIYLIIISYLSQIIRFSLLAVFAFSDLSNLIQKITISSKLVDIHLIITILLSIGYFILNFRIFIECFFGYRSFKIFTKKDVLNLQRFLSKRRIFLKRLNISLLLNNSKSNKISVNQIDQSLLSPVEDEHFENSIFDIYKAISKFKNIQNNVDIEVYTNSMSYQKDYYNKFIRAIQEIENLDRSVHSLLKKKSYFNLDQLIQARISNGFIFNPCTLKIIKMQQKEVKQFLMQQISIIQTTFAFNKHLNDIMTFQASQISYDLYDF